MEGTVKWRGLKSQGPLYRFTTKIIFVLFFFRNMINLICCQSNPHPKCYLLKSEWAVRSTPLIRWKSPLPNFSTISLIRFGHFSGKSSRPIMLMASLSWKKPKQSRWKQTCVEVFQTDYNQVNNRWTKLWHPLHFWQHGVFETLCPENFLKRYPKAEKRHKNKVGSWMMIGWSTMK